MSIVVAIAVGCHPLGSPEPSANLFASPLMPVPPGAVAVGPMLGPQPAPYQLAPVAAQPGGNPIFIPVSNQQWAWEQIIDVVDDYFRIERERQVQLVGNVLTEGRIDTFPQVGATILEPHRPDSVGRYNRWESTFQTIRRRATLRVIPEQSGYLVDIEVQKELEDLPRPEHATAGAASFRHDSSLPSRVGEVVSRTQLAAGWLPLGRDTAVEQQILAEIRDRLSPSAAVAQ